MPKRKSQHPIADALKRAIRDSGMSYRRLERETGVLRQTLMRFMGGNGTLRLDMADKRATYFRLELGPTAKRRVKRKAN
ncbi:unnamed protein product [marine sediment metagenome]|uniref:HTH cro/C1-type domain-containing protein n=1 Tax=marine sediment metagenome TaxID=412755 RepID=X0VL65_9ZZZZ